MNDPRRYAPTAMFRPGTDSAAKIALYLLIYRSHAVICDFSGRNPNVFYETGIAHTLGKTVIPIVQNRSDVPFDLGHIRHIAYHDNVEGRKVLTDALTDKLGQLVKA